MNYGLIQLRHLYLYKMAREEIVVIEGEVSWPDRRRSRQRRWSNEVWIAGTVYFPIGILFLVLGGVFWQTSCNRDASIFLVVHGSLLVANFLVLLIVPNSILLLLIGIGNISVWFWASIQLFDHQNRVGHPLLSFYDRQCSRVTSFGYSY